MVKFSILVPVFNSELYLVQCLESIINQTYENFEVILINDGSIDTSGEICDKYADLDKRISVIHKKNQGPLSSRITAFELAEGDYIIYADSDDFWELNLLEKVYDKINLFDCDTVIWRYRSIDETGVELALGNKVFNNSGLLNLEDVFFAYFKTEELNSLWGKAFRRSLINIKEIEKLRQLDRLSCGEDMVQNFIMMRLSKKVVYIEDVLYNYRNNPDSISKNFNILQLKGLCLARNYLLKELEDDYYEIDNRNLYEFFLIKSFVEQYLSGLSYAASILNIQAVKEAAVYVQMLPIYKKSLDMKTRLNLNCRKKILFFIESKNLLYIYFKISQIYAVKRQVKNIVCQWKKK